MVGLFAGAADRHPHLHQARAETARRHDEVAIRAVLKACVHGFSEAAQTPRVSLAQPALR